LPGKLVRIFGPDYMRKEADNNIKVYYYGIYYCNVLEKMESFISGISAEQVSDDKTVLVMHDDTITVNYQPESYYQSPNWAVLKRKRDEVYKKLAYPHLFE
jgi:hypothetical protein